MWTGNVQDRILYEDRYVIVCHKPAGIAVQNSRMGVMDLESALKNYLAVQNEKNNRINGVPYLAVIHRLDQPVEGILVFGKTPAAAKELNRQLTDSQMLKEYLMITTSKPVSEQSELVDYLVKDARTNTSKVTTKNDKNAKKAILSYQLVSVLDSNEASEMKTELPAVSLEETERKKRYLIKIRLQTGRHHQIRVQMSNAGMPLLGDRKYNAQEQATVPLALCAAHLTFAHPQNKKKMDFEIQPEGSAFQSVSRF